MSLEDIVNEIQKKTRKNKSEVLALVSDKHNELSGLITKEAAAHLVARDLGIEVQSNGTRIIQIKNIFSGMRSIMTIGRVFKTSPINSFDKKNGDKGRVVNLFVADSTGYTRIPLWNDQVKIVEDNIVKIGDVVEISGGLSKENNFGEVEISLGKFGTIRPIEEIPGLPSLEELNRKYFSNQPQRITLEDVVPGNFVFKATVSEIFRGRFLFDSGGEQAMIVSCLLDDGIGTIRSVMFRDIAEKACGVKVSDISGIDEQARYNLVTEKLLGREMIFSGRIKKNEMSGMLEMIANEIKDINPLDESKRIMEELEALVGA